MTWAPLVTVRVTVRVDGHVHTGHADLQVVLLGLREEADLAEVDADDGDIDLRDRAGRARS